MMQSFNSTVERDWMQNSLNKTKIPPGPGTYDLGFSDELKTLDHQLSIRYKINPFGSHDPRFKGKKRNIRIRN